MVCGGLAEGIELHFLESGLRIRPTEGRIKNEHRRFQSAQFQITEDAAVLIGSRAEEAEPVHIKIGGTTAHRMVLPEDPVTVQNDLDRDTVGEIDLEDGLAVLGRNVLAKNFDSASVSFIVKHILEERRDPFDVITGWRWTDDFLQDQMAARIRQNFTEGPKVVDHVETAYGYMEPLPDTLNAPFDFKDVSGLRAFMDVMDEFELDAWVELDGTLVIGMDPNWGEVISVIESADMPELTKYTVTESQAPVSDVILNGTFSADPDGNLWPWDSQNTSITAYASARNTNISGRSITFEPKNVESLAALENIAGRILISETMKASKGTIEFDGLASNSQAKLARATQGSHIQVEEDLVKECSDSPNRISGGEYVVKSVNHRLNPREGWRVVCEVARIPDRDDIETESYRYDAQTGERYEDVEPRESENTKAPEDSPLSGAGLR